jgi:hypothetical protein
MNNEAGSFHAVGQTGSRSIVQMACKCQSADQNRLGEVVPAGIAKPENAGPKRHLRPMHGVTMLY